jgi:hypothetical protein
MRLSLNKFAPLSSRYGKLGALAFLFFLVKGLLWLAVPAVIAWWSTR